MDRGIEKYITDHSSQEDPVLEELYRQTHLRFVNPNMVSGHLQGKLLEMIARMVDPMRVLEIGTFTGYSAICLAKGMSSGSLLITIEPNDELADFAGNYFRKAGVDGIINQVTGRFQDVADSFEDDFDLVFIDGDKREYPEYFRLIIGRVRPGGFIIADNVLWGGKVADKTGGHDPHARGIIEFNRLVRDNQDLEKVILPVRDGLMLIHKKWQ